MTSVDAYRTLGDDRDVRRYILKYHFDEELEAHLGMKPCSICKADFVPTDESAESRHTCEECQQAFQVH